jgi:EAL domain-containing protein (putative c-di-GMP-specific phosphodiesterase class I)
MNLPEELETYCNTHSVPPSSIILEISDPNTIRDPTDLLAILNAFRLKGFRLSIDDFGTGFSSMLHLVRLPFDELKIDRTFISEASTSEEARSVVRCTIDLAHSLGMQTVAEGVESEEVRQLLTGYGCDSFQGYLVSRPLCTQDIEPWLQQYCERLAV